MVTSFVEEPDQAAHLLDVGVPLFPDRRVELVGGRVAEQRQRELAAVVLGVLAELGISLVQRQLAVVAEAGRLSSRTGREVASNVASSGTPWYTSVRQRPRFTWKQVSEPTLSRYRWLWASSTITPRAGIRRPAEKSFTVTRYFPSASIVAMIAASALKPAR